MPASKSKTGAEAVEKALGTTDVKLTAQQKKDIERANKAAERKRQAASKVEATGNWSDPRKKLRQLYCPDSIPEYEDTRCPYTGARQKRMVGKPKKYVFFTDDSVQTHNAKIAEGARPVLFDGEPVRDGRDIMWEMDYDLYEMDQSGYEERSKKLITQQSAEQETEKNEAVEIEEVTVEKGMGLAD